jgi:Chaperone of endosialidase
VYIGNDLQVAFPSYRNIDNISGSFNGVTTSFALLINGSAPVPPPLSSNQCLISVNGVIQKPDDTGASGFRLSGGNIIFSSAPAGGATFFGVVLAGADYVNAGVNFPDGSLSAPSITFDQDNDTGYYRSASGAISFSSNGVASGTWNATGVTAPSFVPTGSTVASNGIYLPSANTVAISTNGSGRLFVDASGRALLGTSTARGNFFNGSVSALYQIEGASDTTARMSAQIYGSNDAASSAYIFAKHRGTSTGGNTIVQNGDTLGLITFQGSDGTEFVPAAYIYSEVDGTPGANDMPGRLVFSTTSDGSASPTERMRLDSSGRLGLGTSSPSAPLTFAGATGRKIGFYQGTEGYSIGVESSEFRFVTDAGGSFSFRNGGTYSSSTPYMTIDSSGRVGIGTTSPLGILQVTKTGGSTTPMLVLLSGGVGDPSTVDPSIQFGGSGVESVGTTKIMSTGAYNARALAFHTGPDAAGTEKVRIDSSGRLLVGTSTARANFYNTTYSPAFQVELANNTTSRLASFTYGAADTSGALLALAKHRSNSVGGTTIVQNGDELGVVSFLGSDGAEFVEAASIRGEVDGTPGANDMPGRLIFSTTADGASSPTERMRITNAGDIGIGIAGTPLAKVDIRQTANANNIFAYKSDTGTASVFALRHDGATGATSRDMIIFGRGPDGVVVGTITATGSATAYNTSSDYRLKENIVPLTGAIDRVSQLQVHRFNFIDNPDTTVDGFIAHEAQAVVPECVTGEKDAVNDEGNPIYQGIDQSKLVPLLTAALQEAIAKIETLEAKVAALEAV